MKNIYSFGIVPSYNYTAFYIAINNKTIIHYDYIRNIEISNNLIKKINNIKDNNIIEFLTIFTGPSTSITSRCIISFIKGWSASKNIPISNIFGENYYILNNNCINIIEIFNKNFLYIENNKKTILNEHDLFSILEKKTKTILFSGINNLKIEGKIISQTLFPNINLINTNSYNNFENQKLIFSNSNINSYNIK